LNKTELRQIIGVDEYSLVICEKSEAARKISEALSNNNYKTFKIFNIDVFLVRYNKINYVICSAIGHLYNLSLLKKRQKLPIHEYEWIPSKQADRNRSRIINSRIKVIEKLSDNANEFILACDLDQEGETIGFNILKYACNEKQNIAKRVKFSTLMKEDIEYAFANMQNNININLAYAGLTRHTIDFLYGMNISRALSRAFMTNSKKYRTLSMGRVQGPTISYLVENQLLRETYVPLPFWSLNTYIDSEMNRNNKWIKIQYVQQKILNNNEAERIRNECKGKKAIVNKIKESRFKISPPVPFNLSGLQKQAFRLYKLNPYQTLTIAEKLYLNALISYPRTNSQKLPKNLDCRRIIRDLSKLSEFKTLTSKLLAQKRILPTQGKETDNAHPSIYPTGKVITSNLSDIEKKVFNLIVKRFLDLFREPASGQKKEIYFKIGKHDFYTSQKKMIDSGWDDKNQVKEDYIEFEVGDELDIKRMNVSKKFEEPVIPYNQMTLIQKMEKEEIGTKSTRANIIRTVIERMYVNGNKLTPTELAKTLVNTLSNYSPEILSSEMTRKMEEKLKQIEDGEITSEQVIENTKKDLELVLKSIKENDKEIGQMLTSASNKIDNKSREKVILRKCTVCLDGTLMITSNFKNRGLVCSRNIKGNCIVKAPLPRNGYIRTQKNGCIKCSWPKIITTYKRRPWNFCSNPDCHNERKRR
tara:strand:- start:2281 stop:4383 length:2103 start_codon:yes stop_codon:yes gene_type:complete